MRLFAVDDGFDNGDNYFDAEGIDASCHGAFVVGSCSDCDADKDGMLTTI